MSGTDDPFLGPNSNNGPTDTSDTSIPFSGGGVNYALDNHNLQSGDESVFTSASDIITKAIPLTGLSIINSFANTGVEIANVFGAGLDKISVQDEVDDPDYLDYYKTHEQGIEAAGLVAGSLIPGIGAVKGVTAAVKATTLMQRGLNTAQLARATGILAPLRSSIVEKAFQEVTTTGGNLWGMAQQSKWQAIALGFGEQAIQGLVYEIATEATMHASPLLDDLSLKDIGANLATGAILGGGVGGVIEGIGTAKLFKTLMLTADKDTKIYQDVARMGTAVDNQLPGDAMSSVLEAQNARPIVTPDPDTGITNQLAGRKANLAAESDQIKLRELSVSLANGDADLGNKFYSVIQDMQTKGISVDDQQALTTRLAKISRIDSNPEVANGDGFYINSFAKGEIPSLQDIVTNTPADETAVAARRYALRDTAQPPVIANHLETIELPDGRVVPKYANATEAFQDGADMFVSARGGVAVNPRAPNITEQVARAGESRALSLAEESKFRNPDGTLSLPPGSEPVTTTPITLNTLTGDLIPVENIMGADGNIIRRLGAQPVVGDFGKPTITGSGIVDGKGKLYPNTISSIITKDTTPLEANARFAWADMRGIKNGDMIDPTDLPMLQTLYKEATTAPEGFSNYIENATKKGVGIEGRDLPLSPRDLADFIRNEKDSQITSLIGGDTKLATSEISRLTNTPENYITNGLKAAGYTDYSIDSSQHLVTNHVNLSYDVGSASRDQSGQIARGMIDSQYRMQLINDNAKTALVTYAGQYADGLTILADSSAADITGAGSGFLSQSMSGYNSFASKFERVGRLITNKFFPEKMQTVSDTLIGAASAIRNDKELAAEIGLFDAAKKRTAELYSFLPEELAKKYSRTADTVVLDSSLIRDQGGAIIDWDRFRLPEGFRGDAPSLVEQGAAKEPGVYTSYDLSPGAAAWERANMQLNDARNMHRNNFNAAQGLSKTFQTGVLYPTPVDVSKYPYFAMIRAKPGTAFADDGVSMFTASSQQKLDQIIASLRDEFDVTTRNEIDKYHQVLGDYDFDRNFAQSGINNEMRRRGILNDIYPETRADSIIQNSVDFHSRQELRLMRDYTELGNGQLFAELRSLGEAQTSTATSRKGMLGSLVSSGPDPYNSYVRTALAITDKESYKLWTQSNEVAEAYASSFFNKMKDALWNANKGVLPYEDVIKIGQQFGGTNPYIKAGDLLDQQRNAYYNLGNSLPPTKILQKWVSTSAAFLSNAVIRLDPWQTVINAVSTPVLMLAEANSAIKAVGELMSTTLPDGTGRQMPSILKLMYAGVKSAVTKDEDYPLVNAIMEQNGIIQEPAARLHAILNDLTLPMGKFSESEWTQKMKTMIETGAKYSGANLENWFGHFMPTYMATKIFTAAGQSGQELIDNVINFTSRVKGNYVASQRPIAFQGPIGGSMGLFQNYYFNIMQQMFRYVGDGEAKSMAILGGLQTSFFGLQGLPGFGMLNNAIGNAAGNSSNKDIYSTATNLMGKTMGDYLMYGATSNVLGAGLYTRGDLNPRSLTVLPLNPLDYPVISGGIRFIGDLMNTTAKIANGGDVGASLLMGLEHNGLNRPLQGLAALVQGYTTTSDGSLVMRTRPGFSDNTMGWNDVLNLSNFSRLAGARPLDEAITMDAMYRQTAYQAQDTQNIQEVGSAVKTMLYNHQSPSQDQIADFATKYVAAGGRIQSFGASMAKWIQQSNGSVANQMYLHMASPRIQNLQMQLGGQRLPDFNTGGFNTGSGQ